MIPVAKHKKTVTTMVLVNIITLVVVIAGFSAALISSGGSDVPENKAPVASFTASETQTHPQLELTFDASASTDDNNVSGYSWDFGDGDEGSGQKVKHIFDAEGTFTVKLTVTDRDGLKNSMTKEISVTNDPPVPVITASHVDTYQRVEIELDGTSSMDDDGTIVEYKWDFGDGAKDTGSIVNHKYDDIGTYTVTLETTDNVGEMASVTETIDIANAIEMKAIVTEDTSSWGDYYTDIEVTITNNGGEMIAIASTTVNPYLLITDEDKQLVADSMSTYDAKVPAGSSKTIELNYVEEEDFTPKTMIFEHSHYYQEVAVE